MTNRTCSDFIKNVWLCGNLSVTGIGNTCAIDTDCISGRCSPYNNECSSFNYKICDSGFVKPTKNYLSGNYAGMGRGNGCIIKSTVFEGLQGIKNSFLTYFILLIVIIIITLYFVLIRKK